MIFQNKTRPLESLPLFVSGFLFSEQAEANAAHLHPKSHSSEQAEANAAHLHPKSLSSEQQRQITAFPCKNPEANEQDALRFRISNQINLRF